MRRVTGVIWEPGVRYRTQYNAVPARWYSRGISTRVSVGTEIFFLSQRPNQPPVRRAPGVLFVGQVAKVWS